MIKKTITLFIAIFAFSTLFTQIPAIAAGIDCETITDQSRRETCKNCEKIPDSTAREACKNNQAQPNSDAIFKGTPRESILGLVPWDSGVNITDEESLKSGIWQIVTNIANDITIIAAYLVLGYVIYGGYLYTFSSGDPTKAASGKKTLTHAFIGLAIVMSANLIMSTIRLALLGSNPLSCDLATGYGCVDPNTMVTNTIQWFIAMAGIVSAIFIVYGGISYTTSNGDPNKLQKAKQTIIYALIGLAIVGLAEFITAFVSGIIRDADNQASYQPSFAQVKLIKGSHEI